MSRSVVVYIRLVIDEKGGDAFDAVDRLLDAGDPQDALNQRYGLHVTSATSLGEADVVRTVISAVTAGARLRAARDAFERCDEAWRAAGPLAPHDLVMARLKFLDELVEAAKADALATKAGV